MDLGARVVRFEVFEYVGEGAGTDLTLRNLQSSLVRHLSNLSFESFETVQPLFESLTCACEGIRHLKYSSSSGGYRDKIRDDVPVLLSGFGVESWREEMEANLGGSQELASLGDAPEPNEAARGGILKKVQRCRIFNSMICIFRWAFSTYCR